MLSVMKHRAVQHLVNLAVWGVCVGVVVAGTGISNKLHTAQDTLSSTIEQTWREQARRTLADLKEQLLARIEAGELDPKNDMSMQKWAKVSFNGVRNGGITSDGFMLRMPGQSFIWDGSSDCAVKDPTRADRKLTDFTTLFQDPNTCTVINKEMDKYYSTKSGDNNWWQFDDAPEFLEWVMIPSDNKGFNDEYLTSGGIINPKYTSFLIQLGTQKDEVFKPYQSTFNTLNDLEKVVQMFIICVLLICLVNVLIYVFISRKTVVLISRKDIIGDAQ